MAKKKKQKSGNEPEITVVGESGISAGVIPEAPEVPEIPDVPDAPAFVEPPAPPAPSAPPPVPTAAIRAFDLPPLKIGTDDSAPAGGSKSVLQGILERTRNEVESETAALMDSLKIQQDAQKLAREEEERRQAAEARARVEEERRRRDAALREYEEKQRRREQAEQASPVSTAQQPAEEPKKKSRGGVIAIAVVVVVAMGGAAVYALMPKGEPVQFGVDASIERARAGMIISTPVAYGPSTLRSGKPVPPEMLVGAIAPEKYVVEPPKPVAVKKQAAPAKPKKLINVRTGILGGKKVVR